MAQLTTREIALTWIKYTSVKDSSKEINGHYNLTDNNEIQNFSKDELIYILEDAENGKVDLNLQLDNEKIKYQTLADRNSTLTITNTSLNNNLRFYKTAFFTMLLIYAFSAIAISSILGYKKLVAKVRQATIEELKTKQDSEEK